MLDFCLSFAQPRKRLGERRVDIDAAAAGGDPSNSLRCADFVADPTERDNLLHARIYGQKSEEVLGLQNVKRQGGPFIGQGHFRLPTRGRGHRTGTVKNHEQSDNRRFFAFLAFDSHRKQVDIDVRK